MGVCFGLYGLFLLIFGGTAKTTKQHMGKKYDDMVLILDHKKLGRLIGASILLQGILCIVTGILMHSVYMFHLIVQGVGLILISGSLYLYGIIFIFGGNHFRENS